MIDCHEYKDLLISMLEFLISSKMNIKDSDLSVDVIKPLINKIRNEDTLKNNDFKIIKNCIIQVEKDFNIWEYPIITRLYYR